MCLLVLLLFGGPRLISIVWYFVDTARWTATFPDGILLPILGFLFLPWTLVMYVLFGTTIEGTEWLFIGLGLLADILAWGSSGWQTQKRGYGFKTSA
jgi:hypothetical protein